MRKLLLILGFAFTLSSCSKQVDKPSDYCWTCTVTESSGYTYEKKGCGEYPTFIDANGNRPSIFCKTNQ